METSVAPDIAALRKLATGELRERYTAVFGEPPKSSNREYVFKKIAYRLQERAFGTLSDRAKARAAELVDEGAIRTSAPRVSKGQPAPVARDPRLPAVGSVLTKEHRGRVHKVLVGAADFEFEGRRYGSLSAIARQITGTAWNGYLFFFGRTKRHETAA